MAQDELVKKPDSLETGGIPQIPISLAKAVTPYTTVYGLTLAGWHPEKREILVKQYTSGSVWIHRISSPGDRQKVWKYIKADGIYDVYMSSKTLNIIYNKDVGGNEQYQMFLFETGDNKSKLISDIESSNTEFVWSNSGDRVVYCRSKSSEGPGVSLYIISPSDPNSNKPLIKSQGNYMKAYDWSPDDKMVVFCEFISQNVCRLWLLNIDTGQKTLLSSPLKSAIEYFRTPQFSKDGKGIYVITDFNSKVRYLAYLDLATKKYTRISKNTQWEIDNFKLSPDGKTIAVTCNEEGVSKLYLYDISTQLENQVNSIPFGVISDLTWHRNSLDLAFNLRSPRTPNDIYSVDIKNLKIDRWTKAVDNGLDLEKMVMPQLIKWKSFDGRQIPGFIYRSNLSLPGKRPVIIFIHGGPAEQYRPEFGYEHNYYLNEMGVTLIYPNLRGSTGYGKDYLHSDNGYKRQDVIKDVGALLTWIKTQDDLDSSRVIVSGESYGGYIALSTTYKYGNKIIGAISNSGFVNIETLISNSDESVRELLRSEFGNEKLLKAKKFMNRISPINNTLKIKTPLLVIHGKNDPRCTIAEARSIIDSVNKNKSSIWYLIAQNEGHMLKDRDNWMYSHYAAIMFVKRILM
jgi:dipeptidyl aminopeptidase/acylaminoacyl peptidase